MGRLPGNEDSKVKVAEVRDFFRQEKKQAVYEDVVRENTPVYAPVNAPVKISAVQKRIILEMRNDPWVTYDQLSQLLKKDRSTIKRNIKRLKELNLVERVGSDKTGYWQVLSGS